MTSKILLSAIAFFILIVSCAKLPINQSKNNDSVLSGGSDTEKPNNENVGGIINPDGETVYPENSALYLGMPSTAKTDAINSFNNYLIQRTYLTTSYNKTKDIPNWVAWHLSKNDLGTTDRSDGFLPDPRLPFEWIWVETGSYTNSNFDRGHNCPSGDRTVDAATNLQTFYMTNIIPQAPNLNQRPWANLEDFIRTTLKDNNYEAYIYNGNCGIGGINKNNEFARKIKNNTGRKYDDGSYDSIWVPRCVFKIVIFLPEGNNDSARIMATNGDDVKVLAVFCPNDNALNSTLAWKTYITDIKSIEDSIIKYKDIEDADKYPITNPLNLVMSFVGRIPDGEVKDKLKKLKWEIVP